MKDTTRDTIKAVLKGDSSLTPSDKQRIFAVITDHGKTSQHATPEMHILRRRETAARFGVSIRCIDTWARKGLLKKRVLPGHVRASGFLSDDVDRLISGAVRHG